MRMKYIPKAVSKSPVFVVIGTLVMINAITFYEHYLGVMTFPWDFLGGYHSHAYAWFAQGSFFDPPKWFPWSDLGFPSFFSLQSGSWYLPLVLLDNFGITYDIVNATRLQSLHVLFGAIGVVAFFRLNGKSWFVALFGAILYHFSATFYSNQQHVDIIRGAAWLPFVLLAISPIFLAKSRFTPIISTFILFQFFVSAYPGLIISTAYASLLVVGVTFLVEKPMLPVISLVRGAVAVTAGILMAGLKFLPLVLHGDFALPEVMGIAAIRPEFIPTFFLPYDVTFLPGDITMRSLWLPTVAFIAIIFLRRLTGIAVMGLTLIGTALLLGGIIPTISPSLDALLGFNVSRFPLSDWRPVLHLGIICLAAESLQQILMKSYSAQPFFSRLLAFLAIVLISLWVYAINNYGGASYWGVLLFVVLAVFCFVMLNVEKHKDLSINLRHVCLFCIIALSAVQGYMFQMNSARPWRHHWAPEIESQIFGGPLIFDSKALRTELSRRGERFVVGTDVGEILMHANSFLYNRNWYEKTFGLFGYNNLVLSRPHAGFREALKEETSGPALLSFARKPQQVVILAQDAVFDVVNISAENVQPMISFVDGVEVEFIEYSPELLRYRITTSVAIRVVENEIWARGWRLRLKNSGEYKDVAVEHTPEFLRTWIVPPGRWDISLQFGENVYFEGWIAWWVGLSLVVLFPWLRIQSFLWAKRRLGILKKQLLDVFLFGGIRKAAK